MAIVNSRAAIEPKTGKAAIFVNETIHSLIRKLFANNEQGFAYDPNDLSTMFQDAAGTVPVTAVGQPVWLMLDKSKGLITGSELAINGDVSNGLQNWSAGNADSSLSVVDGKVRTTLISNNNPRASLTINNLVIGRFYKAHIDVDVGNLVTPQILIRVSTGSVLTPIIATTPAITASTQKVSLIFQASSSTMFLGAVAVTSNLNSYFELSNLSVVELKGDYAYQTTSAARPILRDAPRRIDFDTVDDKLITTLPAQLTNCTVIRSVPNVGTQILTGQTIPTTYNDNKDHCGLIVINRALTAIETSQITKLFNKAAGV